MKRRRGGFIGAAGRGWVGWKGDIHPEKVLDKMTEVEKETMEKEGGEKDNPEKNNEAE